MTIERCAGFGLVFLLLSGAAEASQAPVVLEKLWGEAAPVGRGDFRWFGFEVYQASTWSPEPVRRLDPVMGRYALRIEYRRHIEAEDLVDTSIEEMKKQGAGEPALSRWRRQLSAIFPSVAPGDELIAVHAPERVRFYRGDSLLGIVDDADFSRYFLGIWLGDKAAKPGLRRQLLGEPTR